MKRILITVAFTILLTALCVKAAYITRGYFAIGGEWFLWVYPVLWRMIGNREEDKYDKKAV